MSQVDDWADGYADSARDVNLYGPASANVPRSSVVSHQVRYRAPDTSDIPLASGQNPEGSVYSNASGARMGQTKPASGYRAPAGGWDVNSSDANLRFPNESGGKQYRVSRTQAAKKSVKKKTKSDSKQQPQPEYRTGGARTPEENEIARAAAEHRTGVDLGELSSQALDAAARFLPALKLLGFGAGAGSADTASTDRPSYMGAAGTMADNFARTLPQPSAASRQTDPESSSIEGQFKNMPWYKDAKAHYEAVKKNKDDYGSALGTLKSTWDDIPWWTKLVMLPPVFKAGSPAAGASTAGNVWAEGGRAAAGDTAAGAGGRSFGFDLSAEDVAAANAANAAARQQAGYLSEMRSTLMRAGMPDREIEAYMQSAGFYNNPEALRQAIFTVRKHGPSGLFEHSAEEAAAAGTYIPKYGKSPLETWQQERAATEAANAKFRDMFGFDLGQAAGRGSAGEAAAGSRSFRFDLSPEEVARARASHEAFIRDAAAGRGQAAAGGQAAGREAAGRGQAAGREAAAGEAAADGGVSELANAGNAGRGSADEAMELAANIDGLVRRIKSGTVDEMDKAWIEGLANQKAAGFENEFINNVLDAARAAGIIK